MSADGLLKLWVCFEPPICRKVPSAVQGSTLNQNHEGYFGIISVPDHDSYDFEVNPATATLYLL